jgi:hypothetical protein
MWAEDNLYIINIYWLSITKFIYAISFNVFQNTTELIDLYSLKRTAFVYVLRHFHRTKISIWTTDKKKQSKKKTKKQKKK